jgi:hypothetical protein
MQKQLAALLAAMAQVPVSTDEVVGPYVAISAGEGSVRTILPGDGSVDVVHQGDIETWSVDTLDLGDSTFASVGRSDLHASTQVPARATLTPALSGLR